MKKYIIAMVCAAFAAVMLCVGVDAGTVASGECGADGGNLTWELDDAGTLTISGEGEMEEWSNYSKVPWYKYRSDIEAIVIGDSVTSIGENAFRACSSLTSVTIPDSVTSISNYAFYNCSSLTNVYITDLAAWCNIEYGNLCSYPLYDNGGNLYINGVLATDIVIPDSVTSISNYAFYGSSSLTSVTIPDSVTSIGEAAFHDCSSLTNVVIPDSVTSIGDYAFRGCSSLTSVTIPDSVTSISEGVFEDCSSLTSVTIPDSVTSIDDYAFGGCSSLTNVVIPDSVTTIGKSAFNGCSSLTMVVIPDSVTSIGDHVFNSCSSLTTVVIPDSVTSIGSGAFSYCAALTSAVMPDSITDIGAYAFIDCSNLTMVVIPDGVTSIGDYAFSGCSSLTNVVIPDGVTSIGNDMFNSCSRLTSVTIPDGVTIIGDNAFNKCRNLMSVTIPDSVISVGDEVFNRCYELTEATIYSRTAVFGTDVFLEVADDFTINAYTDSTAKTYALNNGYNFVSLDQIHSIDLIYYSDMGVVTLNTHIAEPCEEIDVYVDAAEGCSLKNIVIIGKETGDTYEMYISDERSYFVMPDEDITVTVEFEVELGGGLTWVLDESGVLTVSGSGEMDDYTSTGSVPWSAYVGEINFVVIGEGVENIGDRAFYGCSNLTGVSIPDSVTAIGAYAFYGCVNLASVSIPETVETIGARAFYGCTKLSSVIINEAVTSVGDRSFSGCAALKKATVYSPTVEFGSRVFSTTHADFTIHGFAGSTAQSYAEANSHKFKVLADSEVEPDEPVEPDDDATFDEPTIAVSSAEALPGGVVKVKVRLFNNPGIVCLKVAIDYDSNVFKLIAVEDAGVLGSASHKPVAEVENGGPYTLLWFNPTKKDNYTSNGVIATLTFKVSEDAPRGEYEISANYNYSKKDAINANLKAVYFNTSPGTVNVLKRVSGDATGDGKTNPVDLVYFQRYLANWDGYDETAVCTAALDLNLDGRADAADATILARHIAKWAGYETLPYIPA